MLNTPIPQPMVVEEGRYLTDGGSVALDVKDANSVLHEIWLTEKVPGTHL
jgi:hypothetical protein